MLLYILFEHRNYTNLHEILLNTLRNCSCVPCFLYRYHLSSPVRSILIVEIITVRILLLIWSTHQIINTFWSTLIFGIYEGLPHPESENQVIWIARCNVNCFLSLGNDAHPRLTPSTAPEVSEINGVCMCGTFTSTHLYLNGHTDVSMIDPPNMGITTYPYQCIPETYDLSTWISLPIHLRPIPACPSS